MGATTTAAAAVRVASTAASVPFDWKPLATVAFCLAVNMYTLTSLFPYVEVMVAGFQGSSTQGVGVRAGYVASSLTLGRTIASYTWGWAADRFGRKPVMVWSMLSIAIFSIQFGTSESFAWAVISRLLLGAANGAMSTGRALVPELAGQERVVTAMSFISGAKAIGMTFGPAFGGIFAEPARHHPAFFSATGVFARYPYLLPNVIGACFALISIPLVLVFVPETNQRSTGRFDVICCARSDPGYMSVETGKAFSPTTTAAAATAMDSGIYAGFSERKEDRGNSCSPLLSGPSTNRSYNSIVSDNDISITVPSITREDCFRIEMPVPDGINSDVVSSGKKLSGASLDDRELGLFGKGSLLDIPKTVTLMFVTVVFSAVVIGFDEAYPLWTMTSSRLGGLDWSTGQIGTTLGISGFGIIFYQFGVYPWLTEKMGIATLQRACGILSVVLYLMMPNIKHLAWDTSSLLVISVIMLALLECANTAMDVGIVLASTNPVPPRLRGKLSGLFLACQGLGRTIGPATWSIMYAWSISATGWAQCPLVDYRFIFILSALVMSLVVSVSWTTLTADAMTKVVDDAPSFPPTPCSSCSSSLENSPASQRTRLESDFVVDPVGPLETVAVQIQRSAMVF